MRIIFPFEEYHLSTKLVKQLVDSEWMDENVVIVTCAPEYSGRIATFVNNKCSYLNNNRLFDSISLDLPKQGMNQVYCFESKSYISFDKHILNWVDKYVEPNLKYLFISNITFTGKNLGKVRRLVKSKLNSQDNLKFVSMFTSSQSEKTPDFFVEEFSNVHEKPIFFWENTNIK